MIARTAFFERLIAPTITRSPWFTGVGIYIVSCICHGGATLQSVLVFGEILLENIAKIFVVVFWDAIVGANTD